MGCQASSAQHNAVTPDSALSPRSRKSPSNTRPLVDHASLGVIRLDYDYPTAPGDIDCADSFCYDVHYKAVPGFTFGMCMSGKMTPEVEEQFKLAVKYLAEEKGVSGITGDCGFMMWFQELARSITTKPVFMSALAQLPAVTCAFAEHEQVIVMTANGKTLAPMNDLIKDECGIDSQNDRYKYIGCESVDGFEAVAAGGKVDTVKVEPGMVKLALESLKKYPNARCFLLECTELPPYSDAIRHATGLPVFDAITNCDFFINSFRDNARFGKNDWQKGWDGVQDKYSFGQNLTAEQKKMLVNKIKEE